MCEPVSRRIFDNGITCSRSLCAVAGRGAGAAAGAGAATGAGAGVCTGAGAETGAGVGADAAGCAANPLRSM